MGDTLTGIREKGENIVAPAEDEGTDSKKLVALIVDDERQLVEFLHMGLSYEGFQVHTASSGSEALRMVTSRQPDIVILDIMLPGISGLEVAQQIRQARDTGIIMLTAREGIEDRVTGLERGADDYVTKPFAFKELLARIRAVLRRRGLQVGNVLRLQDVMLNRSQHTVTRAQRKVELTPREFELLELFLSHAGQVLTKNAILAHVWGYQYQGDDNVVEVYVRRLREKLHDQPPCLLHTVRGVGYVMRSLGS